VAVAHKDISELRRRAAFRRKQSEIHARYTATPADTEIIVVQLRLARELGREPTPEELAAEFGTSSD
jgi:hypothetical protein